MDIDSVYRLYFRDVFLFLQGLTHNEALAEELARRDLDYQPVSKENYDELVARMDDYIAEFEAHGTDNILISTMDEPDV